MAPGDPRPPRPTPAEAALEDGLGVSFSDRDLYRRALTHRSYAFEAGGLPHNERLEFLGDAVLGLIVTTELFHRLPAAAEGRLAKIRAAVVNSHSLADRARLIMLGDAVWLGIGEEASGGRDKPSILADTLEAVLGALYLDQGLEPTRECVLALFGTLLDDVVTRRESLDYKTSLQELTAGTLATVPTYEVTEAGPDHAKRFAATAVIDGEVLGSGSGRSKKEAEQQAAAQAYRALAARLQPAREKDDV